MKDVSFKFAELSEIEDIMQFIYRHWSEKHIYCNSKELLHKDFQWLDKPEKLTIGLAKNDSDEIVGIFCFKFFSYNEVPDLTGSIWKVTEEAERLYQMIGLRLRQFVINNIEHRFFSTPGPGLQTKVIYKMLRLQWHEMKQYYAINPLLGNYKLVKFSHQERKVPETACDSRITLAKAENTDDLMQYDFNSTPDIVPFKDKKYVENRFFNYPFYNYDVFLVHTENENTARNLVVCRRAMAKDENGRDIASAYRIVDFYGTEELLPEIVSELFEQVKIHGDEFLDFVCHGFDEGILVKSGLTSLCFESTDVIIPNWFEPLVQKNVSVNCIADVTTSHCRQCKADGDQDRPSVVPVTTNMENAA